MPLAKCAGVEFEECDDGGGGGYTLNQGVVLGCCGAEIGFAAEFEFCAV
jgi:hypothetical protein